MKQSRVKVAGLIADRTLKSGEDKQFAAKVAAFLLDNRQTGDLDSILRDVQQAWADKGYVEVLAASAHEITDEIIKRIEGEVKKVYPSAKKIIVTPVYDSEIIGGVRLNFASQQLDLTIKSKLNKFRYLSAARKG
jgi:F0F1-type ATP synthase delta subunit